MIALLRALSGLILWAGAFSLIYGLQGLLCSPQVSGWTSALRYDGRELLIGTWLLCLALLSWLTLRLWRGRTKESLLEWLGPILALTGFVSARIG